VGYLNLYAEPWAEVSVDGKRVGHTPIAKVAVEAGLRTVVFEKPGAKRIEKVVNVVAGQTELVDVDMEPTP
jgi:hypothetical protein